jgi:hypothetical protein
MTSRAVLASRRSAVTAAAAAALFAAASGGVPATAVAHAPVCTQSSATTTPGHAVAARGLRINDGDRAGTDFQVSPRSGWRLTGMTFLDARTRHRVHQPSYTTFRYGQNPLTNDPVARITGHAVAVGCGHESRLTVSEPNQQGNVHGTLVAGHTPVRGAFLREQEYLNHSWEDGVGVLRATGEHGRYVIHIEPGSPGHSYKIRIAFPGNASTKPSFSRAILIKAGGGT